MSTHILQHQKHHTKTCRKYCPKNKQSCRFGFPQPLSAQTVMKSKGCIETSPHCYTKEDLKQPLLLID
jgi:hypothetical protein